MEGSKIKEWRRSSSIVLYKKTCASYVIFALGISVSLLSPPARAAQIKGEGITTQKPCVVTLSPFCNGVCYKISGTISTGYLAGLGPRRPETSQTRHHRCTKSNIPHFQSAGGSDNAG